MKYVVPVAVRRPGAIGLFRQCNIVVDAPDGATDVEIWHLGAEKAREKGFETAGFFGKFWPLKESINE